MKVPLKRVMDTESQNEGRKLNSVQKWKLSCESPVKKKNKKDADEKSKEERISNLTKVTKENNYVVKRKKKE